jgi:ABC-type branched-subunit amino acid transport system ATPase component
MEHQMKSKQMTMYMPFTWERVGMRNIEKSTNSTAHHLKIDGLNVFYGQAHALQDISLTLNDGVLAIVGRNGMGKSTLCKAITGMVPANGSIMFRGQELIGRQPHEITNLGVAYVPQGRRVWRSLTVDETLKLASKTARQGAWTIERVYQAFPRLAERRTNGGAQLSGGEQQMLAIGRALLFNPQLLVMDEPTEGLAPVIVEQVATLLKRLADERSMSVLLIEQNLGVALEVADRVAVMVNGRIATTLPATELAADKALQQRLLGVSSGSAEPSLANEDAPTSATHSNVMTVVRSHGNPIRAEGDAMPWRPINVALANVSSSKLKSPLRSLSSFESASDDRNSPANIQKRSPILGSTAYVVGELKAHGAVLTYLRQCLERQGYLTKIVDFEQFQNICEDVRGIISIAGVKEASLLADSFKLLPYGCPKVSISTNPSPSPLNDSDAFLIYSTNLKDGLNQLNEAFLSNAAHALAGMMRVPARSSIPESQTSNVNSYRTMSISS